MTAPILQPTAANLSLAGAALREGKLVAFPTETVYGLGGDATSDRAVAAIYAAKGRPSFNPLIVHVGSFAAAGKLVEMTPAAETLAQKFWPGALTLVLPRKAGSRKDAPIDDAERSRLQMLLRQKLHAAELDVRARPRKTDSAEVYVHDEFIGTISADEDEGQVLTISILEMDLEGED